MDIATITAVAVVEADGDETDPDPESAIATDTEEGEEDGGAAPTGGSETEPRAIGIVAEEVVGEIVGRAFVRTRSSRAFGESIKKMDRSIFPCCFLNYVHCTRSLLNLLLVASYPCTVATYVALGSAKSAAGSGDGHTDPSVTRCFVVNQSAVSKYQE